MYSSVKREEGGFDHEMEESSKPLPSLLLMTFRFGRALKGPVADIDSRIRKLSMERLFLFRSLFPDFVTRGREEPLQKNGGFS